MARKTLYAYRSIHKTREAAEKKGQEYLRKGFISGFYTRKLKSGYRNYYYRGIG